MRLGSTGNSGVGIEVVPVPRSKRPDALSEGGVGSVAEIFAQGGTVSRDSGYGVQLDRDFARDGLSLQRVF